MASQNNSVDNSLNALKLSTTSSSTIGVVNIGGNVFFHAFDTGHVNTGINVGTNAGNLTVSQGSAICIGNGAGTVNSSGFPICVGAKSGSSNSSGGSTRGNTFIGFNAGNASTTGANTGSVFVGSNAGAAFTTQVQNTAIGYNAIATATTGANMVALGSRTLTGGGFGAGGVSNNIAIGDQSGSSYTGSEGSNILIGNTGTAAESHVIHIGVVGTGTGQQNQTIMAGTVYALGSVSGIASTNGLTNVVNTTQSTGADTIKSTSAANNSNTGFIKFWVGTTAVWVPYWTTP